jgi:cytoskeletal protein RodZ
MRDYASDHHTPRHRVPGDAGHRPTPAPSQPKRRTFFASVLAVVFVSALAVALFPAAQAEETVVSSVGPTVSTPATSSTTAAPTTTSSEAPVTTTTAAPTTTAPKPSTTTTTTVAPAPAAIAPATTSAPAPAPAPAPRPAPVATGGGPTPAEAAFLACIRQRESGGNYGVVSSNGLYYGAYQFLRSSWDSTASHAGRTDLIGVAPNVAAPGDQDAMALHLYRWLGKKPWNGAC